MLLNASATGKLKITSPILSVLQINIFFGSEIIILFIAIFTYNFNQI